MIIRVAKVFSFLHFTLPPSAYGVLQYMNFTPITYDRIGQM